MLSRRASAAAEPGTSRYAITPAEDRNSETRSISGTARRRFCAGCPIAFAPLPWSNPCQSAIEIAHFEYSRRVASRHEGLGSPRRPWRKCPYAASDDIDILVMHDGEEPGAKVGTRLPAVLFGDSADQGVLDEVIRPWPVAGQRAGVAPQPQDFFFESPQKSLIPAPLLFRGDCVAAEPTAARPQSRLG